jgi:plastocyanin
MLIGRMTAACLLGSLSGCGIFGPAHWTFDSRADAVVEMGVNRFKPTTITIQAGQIVEWRNVSLVSHTVTGDPKLALYPGDAALPDGAAPFDSGEVAAGDVFLIRFPEPGVYRYFCRLHERHGMVGEITVLPAP